MDEKESVIIRPEKPEDPSAIFRVNKVAFGRESEAALVDKLRSRGALVISLVAVQDNEVIGHIAFVPINIDGSPTREGITLAPLAVLPTYQRKGVGIGLIKAGLTECRRLGYKFVVLVGHPDYYPQFGFIQAKSRGLICEYAAPDAAWMVLELHEGALSGKGGKVTFPPEFAEAV
jgi:putative acetyltransferase